MEREVKEQERRISEDFYRLVGERNLPVDLICNIIVTSQGGLWKHRMIRDGSSAQSRREGSRTAGSSTLLEWRIYRHLLDLHIALLDVGKHELKDLPPIDNPGHDLAQRITATFRRTLPALRIASKWMRANLSYMMQDPEFKSQQQKAKVRGTKPLHKTRGKLSGNSTYTIRFWNRYSQFVTALSQVFPEAHLAPLSHPLEEDIDMRGFLPLKKAMGEGVSARDKSSEAHPNEEQLMRISDLLADAKALASMEDSPLSYENGVYQLKQSLIESPSISPANSTKTQSTPQVTPPASKEATMEAIRDRQSSTTSKDDDAMTEATSRTDEDILNDAFRHVGTSAMDDEDDDEEQIVWNPRATSPILSPLVQGSPITPVKPLGPPMPNPPAVSGLPYQSSLSPKQAVMKTPMASPKASMVHAINAQDLLQNVMNIGRKPGAGIGSMESPRMQAPLLFGSELPNHSIWTASRDEQIKFGGSSNHLGIQTSPRSFPTSLLAPQETLSAPSVWPPQPVHNSGQSSQMPGHVHHGSYSASLSPLQNDLSSHHHRVHSESHAFASHLAPRQYGNTPFNDPAIQAAVPQAPMPQTSLHQMPPQPQAPFVQQQHQQLPGIGRYYDSFIDHTHGYPSYMQNEPKSTPQSYMNSLLGGKVG